MKHQEIKGYKAFNIDLTNRYQIPFEEGKTYTVEGPLKFGNQGNGYHFCKHLEDTLRYVPALVDDIKIAEVTSLSEVVEYADDYYGYYDIYAARELRIDRILTREEIIKTMLNVHEDRVIRFISLFKLTEDEKLMFESKYHNNIKVYLAMKYYFDSDTDIYKNYYRGKIKVKSKDDK